MTQRRNVGRVWRGLIAAVAVLVLPGSLDAQHGHVMHGVGPVNLSMAGAGTALPLDTMGALNWNPASITEMDQSEFGIGLILSKDQATLSSSIGGRSATTRSAIGVEPLPNFGIVQKTPGRLTLGLGGFAIAGVASDYTDPSNPVLNRPEGFGPVAARYNIFQVVPTLAYELTDRLSIGLAPTLNFANLAATPFNPAPPDPITGAYPSGSRGDAEWGIGAQAGIYYRAGSDWSLGASVKSRQVFGTFKINSTDSQGNPLLLTVDLDHPAVYSMGVGYTGLAPVSLAADVRYIDYAHAAKWGDRAGFDARGAVTGFQWEGIWYAAGGAQIDVDPQTSVRVGYGYAQNPMTPQVVVFSLDAPAIIGHQLSAGFSREMLGGLIFSATYHHGFKRAMTGPLRSPSGPVPGASVGLSNETNMVGLAIAKRF